MAAGRSKFEIELNSRYIGDAFNFQKEMTSIYLQLLFLLKFHYVHYDNFPMISCQLSLYLHALLLIASIKYITFVLYTLKIEIKKKAFRVLSYHGILKPFDIVILDIIISLLRLPLHSLNEFYVTTVFL